MTEVTIGNGRLHVEITGWDRVWSLRRRFDIPLAHVRDARIDPAVARGPKGLRVRGTHFLPGFPGKVTAGIFYRRGTWAFWNVHDPDQAIVIDLQDERYARLVLQVADPAATVAAICAALTR